MKFMTSDVCRPFYPFLELLGVLIAALSYLYFIGVFMNTDGETRSIDFLGLLSVVTVFTLGWLVSFLFLNKRQLSIINTAVVAALGATLIIIGYEIISLLYGTRALTTYARAGELTAVFIICFVLIAFWGLALQFLGAITAALISFSPGSKN